MKTKNTKTFNVWLIGGGNTIPKLITMFSDIQAANLFVEQSATKRRDRYILSLSKAETSTVPGAMLTVDYWKDGFRVDPRPMAVRGSKNDISARISRKVSHETSLVTRRRTKLQTWRRGLGIWLGLRGRKTPASGVVSVI